MNNRLKLAVLTLSAAMLAACGGRQLSNPATNAPPPPTRSLKCALPI